jgi:type 1 glutamine amidotransferase
MNHYSSIKRLILTLLLTLAIAPAFSQRQFKVLLFTRTVGWHHESINEGVDAIRKLAERHSFAVDWQENPGTFTDARLADYQAIIFLNTTGDVLNDEQQKAMEKFIRSGKGFVGIHSAADTEYEWEWYTKLVGRMFRIHPAVQTAVLRVSDSKFPGMERIPAAWYWTDEWYEYGEEKTKGMTTLLTVDEKTFDPNVKWGEKVGKGMGDVHPISWYHFYDGGRSFYTGLGHLPLVFSDEVFLQHLYGGIYWAATGKGVTKK